MKVLLLSTSLLGGAGGATYRLHQGLSSIGVASQVLVQTQDVDDPGLIVTPKPPVRKLLDTVGSLTRLGNPDTFPLRFYPNRDALFFPQCSPDFVGSKVAELNPDVINLHWVCGSYVQIERLPKFKRPIVWTLHDMWPFTGGCVHSEGCHRYMHSCGHCPRLHSGKEWDLSRWVWRRKAKAWRNLDLTIVTPSVWLAKCAKSSSLFKDLRIEVIPNGIDTTRYKPLDRQYARNILDLPQDKHIVLFGGWRPNHRWKGFSLLADALQRLGKSGWQDRMELVVFGLEKPDHLADLGIKSHFLGKLNDTISMAVVYSSADIFVAPSVQDNLPTTIIEAIACGTPCVAFRIGGIPDIITHGQNGYLAQPYESDDLAHGIAWMLEDSDRRQRLSQHARARAEQEFTLERYTQRYLTLFKDVVTTKHKASVRIQCSTRG